MEKLTEFIDKIYSISNGLWFYLIIGIVSLVFIILIILTIKKGRKTALDNPKKEAIKEIKEEPELDTTGPLDKIEEPKLEEVKEPLQEKKEEQLKEAHTDEIPINPIISAANEERELLERTLTKEIPLVNEESDMPKIQSFEDMSITTVLNEINPNVEEPKKVKEENSKPQMTNELLKERLMGLRNKTLSNNELENVMKNAGINEDISDIPKLK